MHSVADRPSARHGNIFFQVIGFTLHRCRRPAVIPATNFAHMLFLVCEFESQSFLIISEMGFSQSDLNREGSSRIKRQRIEEEVTKVEIYEDNTVVCVHWFDYGYIVL